MNYRNIDDMYSVSYSTEVTEIDWVRKKAKQTDKRKDRDVKRQTDRNKH